jgi:hypothetical protein
MVVHRGRASARTLLPVFVASVAAASLTLPAGHRDLVHYVRYLAIPFELAVIAAVVIGVRRANRALAAAGTAIDLPERIQHVLASNLPPRVAEIVATELSTFFYALFAWRRRPFVPAGAAGFSYHRRNGYAALLYAFVLLSMVELAVVDLLLRARHAHAANVLLALSVFGVVWLLGLARSVQLRPIVVTGESLIVRNGLLWRLEVPHSEIASVESSRISISATAQRGAFRFARGTPNVAIALRAPRTASGPYGISRTIDRFLLSVDDPQGLHALLVKRSPSLTV